ncbi:MAG: hypothetical protein KDB03_28115, partial [Planctomycetales bacterium]|nr:hypothetical protein [Planctomycetales bacterium]
MKGEVMSAVEEQSVQEDGQADWSPLEHLAAILPVRDLTESLRMGNVPERYMTTASIREQCDQIARRLFRSHAGHVLITGRKGVGKTALVWQLAELAANGSLGRLSQARFLWMDCTNVGLEDSRACLETVFALVSQFDPPQGGPAKVWPGAEGTGSSTLSDHLLSNGEIIIQLHSRW